MSTVDTFWTIELDLTCWILKYLSINISTKSSFHLLGSTFQWSLILTRHIAITRNQDMFKNVRTSCYKVQNTQRTFIATSDGWEKYCPKLGEHFSDVRPICLQSTDDMIGLIWTNDTLWYGNAQLEEESKFILRLMNINFLWSKVSKMSKY